MRDQIKIKTQKVDILGVYFDNVTMLDMIENIKNFFMKKQSKIYLL